MRPRACLLIALLSCVARAQTTQPDIHQWIDTLTTPPPWPGAAADPKKLAILQALPQQGDAALPAVPAVAKLISDPAYARAATDTLQAIGPRAGAALMDQLLSQPDLPTAAWIVHALAAIDAHPAQMLVKLGLSPDPTVRAAAVGESARLGKDQLPVVTAALQDRATIVRQAAVDGLRNLTPLPPDACAAVQTALAAETNDVVCDHIAQLALSDAHLLLALDSPLLDAINHHRFSPPRQQELQSRGVGDPKTPAARLALLHAPDPNARMHACALIAQFPADSLSLLPALLAAASSDPQSPVRSAAGQAVIAVLQEAQRAAVPGFADAAVKIVADNTFDLPFRDSVFIILCSASAQAPAALNLFVDSLSDPHRTAPATVALQNLLVAQDPAVLDAFSHRLHDADPALRRRLLDLLSHGGIGAADVVARLLLDPDPVTRAQGLAVALRLNAGDVAEVRALLALIKHADVDAKADAVTAVSNIVQHNPAVTSANIPELLPALRTLLDDEDHAVRVAADAAIRRLDPRSHPLVVVPPTAGVLMRWIEDTQQSHLTRVWACEQLKTADVKLQGQIIMTGLTKTLADPYAPLRAAAARALADFAPSAAPAVPALMQLARADSDADVRAAAGDTLAAIDDLRAARGNGQDLGIFNASEAAGVLADRHAALNLRMTAAQFLCQKPTDAVLPALIVGLRADHHGIRSACAQAIAVLGPGAASAAPQLVTATRDWDFATRAAAVSALARIAPSAPGVWSAFAAAVQDADPAVRAAALDALPDAVGPDAATGLPALVSLAWTRHPDNTDAPLCAVLAKLGAKLAAVPPLPAEVNAALQDPDIHRRIDAFQFAASLGPAGRPALDAMLKSAAGDDPAVATQAFAAMRQMNIIAPSAVPALIDLTRKPSPAARQDAALTLIVLGRGNPAALDRLRELANTDPDEHVRARIAELLAAGAGGVSP